MALTATENLYNISLSLIGEDEVTEGQTSTKQYLLCARHYAKARDEVLCSHLWNEAITRVMVVQSSTDPIFGFSHSYALPSDCLRIISIGDDVLDWQVEGSYVNTDFNIVPPTWAVDNDYVAGQYVSLSDVTYLCNVSNTSATATSPATDAVTWTTAGGDYTVAHVVYVKQLTDIDSFSPRLYDAIAHKLAIKIVVAITGDMKNKVQLVNEFEQIVMPAARSIDAAQGRPKKIFSSSSWIRSRRG